MEPFDLESNLKCGLSTLGNRVDEESLPKRLVGNPLEPGVVLTSLAGHRYCKYAEIAAET